MALRFEQVQRQTQKLILSPQMQQAIKLLQLPLLQLQQALRLEMLQNPVLEQEMLEEEQEEAEETETQQEREAEEAPEKDEASELKFEEEFDRLVKVDDEWKDYFRQSGSYRTYSEEDEEKRRFLEASVVKPETLQDNLLNQIGLAMLDAHQLKICEAIIGNIDDNGYLQSAVEDIAAQLGVPVEEVEKMLSIVQGLSPVGVGARNARECLLIQLSRLGKKNSLAYTIVESHLDAMSSKKYRQIAIALKAPLLQVQAAAELIATLEPKPGRIFSSEMAQYITPDVFVEKDGTEFNVILNDDRIPHLRISNLYKQMVANESTDKTTRSYIRDKIKGGQWLMRNIQQRQQTIYNIATEIVKRQHGFFEEGVSHLKPLTMQQAADEMGIHESTVSRAISGKYIQTPHGLFDMKYFFSAGVHSGSGEHVSVNTIKAMIQQIVARENPQDPLSDQQIIATLKAKGLTMARRTITKYRKEFNIPPSHQRRKF